MKLQKRLAQDPARRGAVLPLLLLLVAALASRPAAAGDATTNPGTLTYIPPPSGLVALEGITEVSPGKFVGLTDGSPVFLLTSQGKGTIFCQSPSTKGLNWPTVVQAVDGRLYGSGDATQGGVNTVLDFSFGLDCHPQSYPTPIQTIPFVPTPDGYIYGTQWSGVTNAFVRIALDGSITTLHTFTPQEGSPAGTLILASDGNFYGAAGTSQSGSPAESVYRVTPQGQLTILVTYSMGFPGTNPGQGNTLLQANNGKLYGVSYSGGAHSAGTIFELSLGGKDFRVLYDYPHPLTGVPTTLSEGPDGNLYGVAQGEDQLCACSSLFRISLQGKYETLQHLNPEVTSGCPCFMTLGSDGKFYGTSDNSAWVWDLGLPGPKPILNALRPTSGATGQSVIIWGRNLLGATAVSFNGAPATTFANISSQFVRATVPAGATSGTVTITTANGAAASPAPFTVE
jgi:uncharacterized repeat protein (TIGR03803 family)